MSIVLYCVPYRNLNIVTAILLFIYLYIDYKQLFGYNWWGTAWRMLMVLVIIIMVVFNVGSAISVIVVKKEIDVATILGLIAAFIVIGCITWLVIYCIDIINRKTWRERGKWKAWRLPIIASIIIVVILSVITALSL